MNELFLKFSKKSIYINKTSSGNNWGVCIGHELPSPSEETVLLNAEAALQKLLDFLKGSTHEEIEQAVSK